MKRTIEFLERLEENFLGLSLLGVAIFVFFQVILRYIFKIAPSWGEELDRYWAIMLTFLGTSLGVKHNTHFNVEAFVQFLPKHLRRYVDSFVFLLCACFFGFVSYLTILHIFKIARFGSMTPTLRIPMYVPYIPIVIFSSVAALRYVFRCISSIRASSNG